MVCDRCKMVVDNELNSLGVETISVSLGEVQIRDSLTEDQKSRLADRLKILGFELLDDRRIQLVEMLKAKLVEIVQYKNGELGANLSDYLGTELGHDYSFMSKMFSEVVGMTIERYFIALKIEKVKEWLLYDQLSLSEIAFRLNYSSVAYLSTQFKKVTGLTPSQFKQSNISRKALDDIC